MMCAPRIHRQFNRSLCCGAETHGFRFSEIGKYSLILQRNISRLTDAEMNKLKGGVVDGVKETACKIPVLVIARNMGSGKSETLEGVELIAPSGFGIECLSCCSYSLLGRDFWVAAQLNSAHASGRRDDMAAHLESRCLDFPTDYADCIAGQSEMQRMKRELEVR